MLSPKSPAPNAEYSTKGYEGGLARSLVRTLILFTFIPLVLMAGAAYLRSRALLREQVVGQMQTQLKDQLKRLDLTVKTKAIRLDRLARGPSRSAEFEAALKQGSGSTEFSILRAGLLRDLRSVSAETGRATFNDFFLAGTDGTILMASRPEWQGISLRDAGFYPGLLDKGQQSFMLYDAAPLYPKDLILATVSQVQGTDGNPLGILVGVTQSEELQAVLANLAALNPNSEALYLTEDGKLIGTDQYTSQMSVVELPGTQQLLLGNALAAAKADPDGKPASVQFTDKEGAAAFGQTTWLDSIHAGVVYEVHADTIFRPLNSLIPFTVVIVIATLLAMGGLLAFGASRVFRPLSNLTEITNRFAAGDFSQRAQPRTKDEIGMLSQSFNRMAEELSDLYRSLEQKVDERTRQIHTAAEVAQRITSTTNLDELLNRTVQLIVQQFDFYQASIFMLDQRGRYAVLQAAYGPAAAEMLSRGHRLEVGSASIIGWATANKQPRVASDVLEDPMHLKNELLPETRSEAGIPISIGNLVLGALDVQSTSPGAFGADTIVMLQLIASQLAVAIQNVGLVQSTQVNIQDLERLQRSGLEVISAKNRSEVLQVLTRIVADAPYSAIVISVAASGLQIEGSSAADRPEAVRAGTAVHMLEEHLNELRRFLAAGAVIEDVDSGSLPLPLSRFARQMGYHGVAFVPILSADALVGLLAFGSQIRAISAATIQPYANLADLAGIALDKIAESAGKDRQLLERQALTSISQTIAVSTTELDEFLKKLHGQVQSNIGDFTFLVNLYDKSTESISVPYRYEYGRVDKIDSHPLGEGLSSTLIRTGRPLLLVENVERQAAELGAETVGRPARSWMGAPISVQGEPIGALILQDPEHEHAFTEENLAFLAAMANQVATVLHNARLLQESRTRTLQLETAAEIARDVSGSLNLDELLAKAVGFVRERFDFYHASIFLLDPANEYAIIREATGEAGAQMKRAGHKLAVGSKSIVGYVAGRGEPLVVNDTAKDATYYANPLLPGTRSEAALPLKVGERIVGVIDVQSSRPFAFTPDSLRTLGILANQLGVAVVNSELFAETQEHLSQQRLLHHITTSAASGTTLEEALDSAVTGLQVTLGGDRVAIMLVDRERKVLEVRAAAGYSEDILHLRVPVGAGITGWAAMHRRALRVDNVSGDPRYIQASSNTSSELAIPLLYRNEVLGVLNVESEQSGAYSQDDEEMLGTLGGSLAAIIANARLLEQLRAQAERERAIYEITSKIRRSTNMETILATTASELTKAVGARQAHIRVSPRPSGDGQSRKDGDA
ncbi:MAG TPA: GAF domain-containing protein [Anaerolineales bacterium]|nr:GAF domain-containing protein [Anaerolineales bacterium]